MNSQSDLEKARKDYEESRDRLLRGAEFREYVAFAFLFLSIVVLIMLILFAFLMH